MEELWRKDKKGEKQELCTTPIAIQATKPDILGFKTKFSYSVHNSVFQVSATSSKHPASQLASGGDFVFVRSSVVCRTAYRVRIQTGIRGMSAKVSAENGRVGKRRMDEQQESGTEAGGRKGARDTRNDALNALLVSGQSD